MNKRDMGEAAVAAERSAEYEWPHCFESGSIAGMSEGQLLADANSAWGNCMAGAQIPSNFGDVMQKIGKVLGIVATPEGVSKASDEWFAKRKGARV